MNGDFRRLTQFMYLRIHIAHSPTALGRTRLQSNYSEESGVVDKALTLVSKMFTEEGALKYKLCWQRAKGMSAVFVAQRWIWDVCVCMYIPAATERFGVTKRHCNSNFNLMHGRLTHMAFTDWKQQARELLGGRSEGYQREKKKSIIKYLLAQTLHCW